MSKNRTLGERVMAFREPGHRFVRCTPRVGRAVLHQDERETIKRLFLEYGIKYTKTMRRLRVHYRIPWGVPFDAKNPAACPEVGRWNERWELLQELLVDQALN